MRRGFFLAGLLGLYLTLCYFSLYQDWGLDFSSYYHASLLLRQGGMPYAGPTQLFDAFQKVFAPLNPNPPFTLMLFSFFTYFGYVPGFLMWLAFSTTLGILGVERTLACFCPKVSHSRERMVFMLGYFALYPIIMNTIMLQLGGCLLFLLIKGYEAYLKRQERWAGFWWALLISLKLFPGLLFFYVLLQKRWQLFVWMGLLSLGFTLLPLFFVSHTLYLAYFSAVSQKIFWYGINWNLSLLGFLYRIFLPGTLDPLTHHYEVEGPIEMVKLAYVVLSLVILMGWFGLSRYVSGHSKSGEPTEAVKKHQAFNVVIILMFLLSPFGWLYYFPMLLMPMICCFQDALFSPVRLMLWFFSLFFLCFPMPVTHVVFMPGLIEKLSIYSIQFYGLLILGYLTVTYQHRCDTLSIKKLPLGVQQGMIGIIAFGLFFIVLRCMVFLLRSICGGG